jgi:uncharacterized protein YcaQ
MGLLQLDAVNVLCRSHYLPAFGRLGAYPRSLLDRLAWTGRPRALFEYWGHKASILPVSTHPLLRWRMEAARAHRWGGELRRWREVDPALHLAPWAVVSGMTRLSREQPRLVDEVLAVVRERGPVAAAEASPDGKRHGDGQDVGTGTMWNWNDAKIALEWLLYMGRVTTSSRRGFERIYDLSERVLPTAVLAAPAPDRAAAQRELLRIAARAHGVATARQLAEYFCLPGVETRARLDELVEAGELVPARVEGIPQRAYRWHAAEPPARCTARALLSPFDPLIWSRDRALALFGFHYRISIYTPAARRDHGFFVMPFLLGERLVARVDVRADRPAEALRVPVVNGEPGIDPRRVAAGLAAELRALARWLELPRIAVGGRGDLASALSRALGPGA